MHEYCNLIQWFAGAGSKMRKTAAHVPIVPQIRSSSRDRGALVGREIRLIVLVQGSGTCRKG